MTGEFYPKQESLKPPGENLVNYFRGKFSDAYKSEEARDIRDDSSDNGAFVRSVPLEDGHLLTRGSDRIILKPPHPGDLPGYYCKVYALNAAYVKAQGQTQQPGATANQYLLRDYRNNRPGPYWLIDNEGAREIGFDDSKPVEELIRMLTIDESLDQLTQAQDIARSMLDEYSHYNIVASND